MIFMPKKVFISYSYKKREQFQNMDLEIKKALTRIGFEGYSFVFDQHLKFKNDQEMMVKVLGKIDECDILIAELSDKQVGIGLEVGYAKAKNKRIIYIKRIDAAYSTTVGGVADDIIDYKNCTDLIKKIVTKLL